MKSFVIKAQVERWLSFLSPEATSPLLASPPCPLCRGGRSNSRGPPDLLMGLLRFTKRTAWGCF